MDSRPFPSVSPAATLRLSHHLAPEPLCPRCRSRASLATRSCPGALGRPHSRLGEGRAPRGLSGGSASALFTRPHRRHVPTQPPPTSTKGAMSVSAPHCPGRAQTSAQPLSDPPRPPPGSSAVTAARARRDQARPTVPTERAPRPGPAPAAASSTYPRPGGTGQPPELAGLTVRRLRPAPR